MFQCSKSKKKGRSQSSQSTQETSNYPNSTLSLPVKPPEKPRPSRESSRAKWCHQLISYGNLKSAKECLSKVTPTTLRWSTSHRPFSRQHLKACQTQNHFSLIKEWGCIKSPWMTSRVNPCRLQGSMIPWGDLSTSTKVRSLTTTSIETTEKGLPLTHS